jgi:hypothetical protein
MDILCSLFPYHVYSPAFDKNPIGVEFDPDELVKKFQAGVPIEELVARD